MTLPLEPYKGLRPYEEQDQHNFFGREAERQILIDKILTNKLTLLFAASGVGKSSLLQASVIPELKRPDGENLDVVYFKDWVDQPLFTLKETLLRYLQTKLDDEEALETSQPLREFLHDCTLFTSDPLVIILDQFEEFFNYQRYTQHFHLFVSQLTHAILDHLTPTVFVISMREDFALELNAFKPHLPTLLFENFYRLEKLTLANAKKAIAAPVEKLGFQYEGDLLDVLIQDLSQREQVERFGTTAAATLDVPLLVEPPSLQMVCTQLWEWDRQNPQRLITKASYEKRGKAFGLLKNYFEEKIKQFSVSEKRLASAAFNYLVNKHGTKMAYPRNDLAKLLRQEELALGKVLDKLEQARVLRRQIRQEVFWYELYHDMFSKSIYDWNERYKTQQRWLRLGKIVATLVVTGSSVWLGYDYWVNATSLQVRLSVQAGISDTVEVYQGQTGSFDLWKQQHFLYETAYQRADIESDKLFNQAPVFENSALQEEIVSRLPLVTRVTAYWENGLLDRALELAQCSVSNDRLQLSEDIIWNIKLFRTKASFELLVKWLQSSLDGTLRSQVIEVLGEIQAPERVLPLLIQAIQDNHVVVQAVASTSLGNLGLPEAVQPLIALLNDQNYLVRFYAARALGNLGSSKAIQPLLALLTDQDSTVRYNAAVALGELGSLEAFQLLIALLTDQGQQSYMRSDAASVLGKLGSQEAVQPLITSLKDQESYVRSNAASALGKLGSQEAIQPLIAMLTDQYPSVSSNAAESLENLGSPEVVQSLIVLLTDQKADVRSNSADALGNLGLPEAVQPLIVLLKDQNSYVRYYTASALGKLDSLEAVQPLITLLTDQMPNVRSGAARALGKLGSLEAVQPLIALLKDQKSYVRTSAAESLGKLGSPETIQALITLLTDQVPNVRSGAAWALGKLGSLEAVQPLIALLKDSNPGVRTNVAEALGLLGSPEAAQPLIALLNQDASGNYSNIRSEAASALKNLDSSEGLLYQNTTKSEEIPKFSEIQKQATHQNLNKRRQAAEWLGQIPTLDSLQLLQTLLQDNNLTVKVQAIESIGKIGHLQLKETIAQLLQMREQPLFQENSRIHQAVNQALTALSSVELKENTAYFNALEQIANSATEIPAQRRLALEALAKLGTETAIQRVMQIVKTEPNQWVTDKIMTALPAEMVSSFLTEQLQQLESRKQQWRDQRDKQEQTTTSAATTGPACPTQSVEINAEKSWQYGPYETQLGYTLAHLKSSQGIELLAHPLINVRKGAWFGLARIMTAELLKKLIEQLQQEKIQPHVRHALYRAIDHGLITLEVKGDQQTGADLKKLQPIVTHKATRERLEWTIAMLKHRRGLSEP